MLQIFNPFSCFILTITGHNVDLNFNPDQLFKQLQKIGNDH